MGWLNNFLEEKNNRCKKGMQKPNQKRCNEFFRTQNRFPKQVVDIKLT